VLLILKKIHYISASPEMFKENIKNKKIVVCFMVKDGDKYLKKNISKLNDFLNSNFYTYNIIYVENDSKDNTRKILKNFEYEIPLSGIMLDLNKNHSTNMCSEKEPYNCNKRTRFLAYLRQKLVNIVKKKFYNYDYMLMCDLDFVDFDSKILKDMFSIAVYNNFDSIFGMSLRLRDGTTYDTGAIKPWYISLLYKINYIPKNNIVKVSSAFSGFGIYSIKKIIDNNCNYDINNNDVEHINFNKNINTYIYNNFNPIYYNLL
jgi:hypothetical protein